MPLARSLNLSGHGNHVLSQCVIGNASALQPSPSASRVSQRLLSREGFRTDNEQRAVRIQAVQDSVQIFRIDVGHKMRSQRRSGRRQRIADQAGSQIRTANPQVHDVGE